MKKKILFITGTRADFGKLKPLIKAVQDTPGFDYQIFGTGMHMLAKYGNTIVEIKRSGFENLFMFINQMEGDSMEIVLANTIKGLTSYLHENFVDMIVIHGDRIEALAGAIVGALRNVLVAHVEGGEISGTIDDLLRHATSKLSHIHFVASVVAERRLRQLGEIDKTIFRIGSPDIDVMFSDSLPTLDEVKAHYEIDYDRFAIAILHPVTTEEKKQEFHARQFARALLESTRNYVLIYPNNDLGSKEIFHVFDEMLVGTTRVKMFPSLRFEYFLSLLKHSEFIIGNSSAGIHEAPVYGVPTINIGSRQNNRLQYDSILNVEFDIDQILEAVDVVLKKERYDPCDHYGDGKSAEKFVKVITSSELWEISHQKSFSDINIEIANVC